MYLYIYIYVIYIYTYFIWYTHTHARAYFIVLSIDLWNLAETVPISGCKTSRESRGFLAGSWQASLEPERHHTLEKSCQFWSAHHGPRPPAESQIRRRPFHAFLQDKDGQDIYRQIILFRQGSGHALAPYVNMTPKEPSPLDFKKHHTM